MPPKSRAGQRPKAVAQNPDVNAVSSGEAEAMGERERKQDENKVLLVVHKAIDRIMSTTFTSVDIVFLLMMALMWMASSKTILRLKSMSLLQAGFFTLVCLVYGPGSELVFRRPTTFSEVAVVAKVWLAHFLVIGGVVPVVLFAILGFESSSSLTSSSIAHLLNIGALVLRFFVMDEAGNMYCRKWMGKYHSSKTTQLIRSGPYKYVRHPGFSAHILQSTAVAVFLVGGWMGRLVVTMLTQLAASYLIFFLSANREEQALLADPEMAEEYREYMLKVPMQFIPEVDLIDFAYVLVGLMQGKCVKITHVYNESEQRHFFTSIDKGNFLETNHAQWAWEPILSIESAGGAEWKELRAALRVVLAHIRWEDRIEGILQRNLKDGNTKLDMVALQRALMRIFYELVTFRTFPEEDYALVLKGVHAWTRQLAGRGFGDHGAKCRLLEYMRTAVGKTDGHPLDEKNMFIMSAIMQPLFVSPMINIPDVFSAAESCLKNLGDAERETIVSDKNVCQAFLKECIRTAHPFPFVERNLKGGPVGSYQHVCRFDFYGKTGPEFDYKRWLNTDKSLNTSCPFEPMIFAIGPRGCQGGKLAMEIMSVMLMHHAKNQLTFRPSEGHCISGRTNDDKNSFHEDLHNVYVFLLCVCSSTPICAPLRAAKRMWRWINACPSLTM